MRGLAGFGGLAVLVAGMTAVATGPNGVVILAGWLATLGGFVSALWASEQ